MSDKCARQASTFGSETSDLVEVRLVRIVVASPKDVQAERETVAGVARELNELAAPEMGLRLEVLSWDVDAYPGFHPEGPQGIVDSVLNIENSDLVIFVFWSRFGTPTQDAESGTEHEFNMAYKAWKQRGQPQIMAYFKKQPFMPKTSEENDQMGKVIRFKNSFPKEGFSWDFGEEDFENLLRGHLMRFLFQNKKSQPENRALTSGVISSAPPMVAELSRKDIQSRLEAELKGRYRIDKTVEESDAAIVFHARDLDLNRNVVIKSLKTDYGLEKWLELGDVRTRNIMSVYWARLFKPPRFIVLEHVDGVNLKEIIDKTGPLPIRIAKNFMYQIGEALLLLHSKQISHLGINTFDVIVHHRDYPVITPLSLNSAERYAEAGSLPPESSKYWNYWSPEELAVKSDGEKDGPWGASDQFSFGLVSYEMFTGESLFGGKLYEISKARTRFLEDPGFVLENLEAVGCPAAIVSIIDRLLQKEPSNRFSGIHEVLYRLSKVESADIDDHVLSVRASFKRCRMDPKFFGEFYSSFFVRTEGDRHGGARNFFANVDESKQHRMLQHGIYRLLEYAQKTAFRDLWLQKVAGFHEELRFPREYYRHFLDCLVETASKFDTEWSDELAVAWRDTLHDGFYFMRRYRSRDGADSAIS